MELDDSRIDEAVLALLACFSMEGGRTWKGFDFGVMNRLHQQGFIDNPVGRTKSVYLTAAGLLHGSQLAEQAEGRISAGSVETNFYRLPATTSAGGMEVVFGVDGALPDDVVRHYQAAIQASGAV